MSCRDVAARQAMEVSVMTRCLPFLIVCVCALFGCAPAAAPPLPLTTPVPNSPQEYRVVPVRWQENTVATYDMQDFRETLLGDEVTTSQSRHVFQMRVVERGTQGIVRVRFALDGAEFGQVRFDDQGRVVDAAPTDPAYTALFRAMVQLAGSAALREYASTTFRQGEAVRVRLPSAAFAQALPPEFRSSLAENVPMDMTYVGHVRVGDAVAAAITTRAANLLKSPICGPAQDSTAEVCLTEFRLDGTEYRDPRSGHLIAEYSVGTATGRVDGRPLRVRTIIQKTLEPRQSSGL
jgi:hypothetical protein